MSLRENIEDIIRFSESNKGNSDLALFLDKITKEVAWTKSMIERAVRHDYVVKVESGNVDFITDNKEYYNKDFENVINSTDMHELINDDDPRCLVIVFKKCVSIDDAKLASVEMLDWINDNNPGDDDIKMTRVSHNKTIDRCEVRFTNLIMASKKDMISYLCDLISAGFVNYIDMKYFLEVDNGKYLSPGSVSRSTHERLKKIATRNPLRVKQIIAKGRTYRHKNDTDQPGIIIVGNITINNYNGDIGARNELPEELFIRKIINEKPSWYIENGWVSKNIIKNEYVRLYGDINDAVLTARLKCRIFDDEKRIQKNGKRQRVAKLRRFCDIV